MPLLPILQYPDPRLHAVAAPVTRVDDKIRRLIKDMADTMYAAPGGGLAATQVDVHRRVIIVDISETHDQLKVFINPEIIARSGASDCAEGCLSVPGIFEKIQRSQRLRVRAPGGPVPKAAPERGQETGAGARFTAGATAKPQAACDSGAATKCRRGRNG